MSHWQFFSSTERTARKPRRCAEGNCEIKPGDRYTYHAGKVEGCFEDYALCEARALITCEIQCAFPDDYEEGFPLGMCRELLRTEHGVEGDPVEWARQHRAERLARQVAAEGRRRILALQLDQREAALDAIRQERARQIAFEGWLPEHDDGHAGGQLARAAAAYAWLASLSSKLRGDHVRLFLLGRWWRSSTILADLWPWSKGWLKPKDRRRDLVRAGALIVAELERLDRAAAQQGGAV